MTTVASSGAVLSRRAFFGRVRQTPSLGRTGVLAALASTSAALSGALAAPPEQEYDLDPRALIVKLVRRCTFGPTAADLLRAQTLGFDGYLSDQLKGGSDGLGSKLSRFSLLKKSAAQIFDIKRNNFDNAEESRRQLQHAAIVRAIFSKKQLLERLVEFWGDHFNIVSEEDKRVLKLVDDRNVIRKHALTTFPRLLLASAQSAAMMRYLNNDESSGDNPNENYAREVMELHTLSVTGGYTQDDIASVAKCLTGWGLFYEWDNENKSKRGAFRFDPDRHNTNDKIVLGNVIPGQSGPAGIQEGIRVMQILSEHPACARFIATKLCRKFLQDQPPARWVDEVAATYTETGGDIPSMIRTILTPERLLVAKPRLKRPFHLFASAVRTLNARTQGDAVDELRYQLELAGQEPFGWHPPNGYPDAPGYWANNPLPRWNFAANLAWGNLKSLQVDAGVFFEGLTTAPEMLARINARVFQGTLPNSELLRIQQYLAVAPTNPDRQFETLGLALSTPSFQWY